MSGSLDDVAEIRIRVAPEPTPEQIAVIVAAVRARRRRAMGMPEPPARPASRWARAGRQEAMVARDLDEANNR